MISPDYSSIARPSLIAEDLRWSMTGDANQQQSASEPALLLHTDLSPSQESSSAHSVLVD